MDAKAIEEAGAGPWWQSRWRSRKRFPVTNTVDTLTENDYVSLQDAFFYLEGLGIGTFGRLNAIVNPFNTVSFVDVPRPARGASRELTRYFFVDPDSSCCASSSP